MKNRKGVHAQKNCFNFSRTNFSASLINNCSAKSMRIINEIFENKYIVLILMFALVTHVPYTYNSMGFPTCFNYLFCQN